MNTEIDGSQKSVVHLDEISSMGVRDHDTAFGIEISGVPVQHETTPARGGEKVADFLIGGGAAGDGGLPDQESKSGIGGKSAEENHFVTEEFVVKGPALQIVDGEAFGSSFVRWTTRRPKKSGQVAFSTARASGWNQT